MKKPYWLIILSTVVLIVSGILFTVKYNDVVKADKQLASIYQNTISEYQALSVTAKKEFLEQQEKYKADLADLDTKITDQRKKYLEYRDKALQAEKDRDWQLNRTNEKLQEENEALAKQKEELLLSIKQTKESYRAQFKTKEGFNACSHYYYIAYTLDEFENVLTRVLEQEHVVDARMKAKYVADKFKNDSISDDLAEAIKTYGYPFCFRYEYNTVSGSEIYVKGFYIDPVSFEEYGSIHLIRAKS